MGGIANRDSTDGASRSDSPEGRFGPRPNEMPTSPTVLRLITRLNIGGPAIQALLLTRSLRETHPTVLAAGSPSPEEGELSHPDVVVTKVPLVRPIRPHQDVAAYVSVLRLISDTGVSLVHTHMAKAGIVGRVAARHSKTTVRTVHTFDGHVLSGYFSAPVQRSFIAMERWLASRTDVLIAVSDEVRDSLLDLGIGHMDQFHVIRHGFDLSSFLAVETQTGAVRRDLGLSNATPLVGIVGRLVPIKDHATMLRAIARLPDVHLAVLGDGEKRSEVEGLVERLGLSNRVHMLGWRHDVAACYADIDVVALTSRNEGTPVSLIEASAAARPIISTDVGGVRTVISDGKTGLLVGAEDDAAIASAIRRLIDDPAFARGLGTSGRSFVRKRFDQKRLVAETTALYDDLLKRSNGTTS